MLWTNRAEWRDDLGVIERRNHEATLTAAGLDVSVFDEAGTATMSVGWPLARSLAATSLPTVVGAASDALVKRGEILGEGGMGLVHAGHQRGLERAVAIKTVRPPVTEERVAALVREARVVSAVAHPHVVPVHLLGRDDAGQPVIVMKQVEGESWAARLAREEEAAGFSRFTGDWLAGHLGILMAVARALEHAHAQDVLHRDVKPSNVMLGSHGAVYLVDWGIAASIGERAPPGLHRSDAALHVAGTPSYLAPEQASPDGSALSRRTDVFLLGAALYRLLSGTPPHQGGNAMAKLCSALSDAEPPLPTTAPQGLVRVCRRAMAADSDARHPSAAALREAIESYLRGRTTDRLLAEAGRRLEALRREVERPDPPPDVTAAYGACRFAFRQAQRERPDDPAVSEGLTELVALMVRHALAHDRVSAAEALLVELPAPDPELEAACRDARALVAERTRRLETLEHEVDQTVGDELRGWLMFAPAWLWLGAHLWLGWGHRAGTLDVPLSTYAYVNLSLVVLMAGTVWQHREIMFAHPTNRRSVLGGLAVVAAFDGILVLSAWLGVPLHHAIAVSAWVAGCIWAVGAVAIERVQAIAAAGHWLSLPLILAFPRYTYDLVGFAVLLGHGGLGVAWVLRARHRRRARPTP